ncbi:MAG TPA: hypothetical protein DF480_05355 [Clostridiales bacterium]|nr:hypothetical protein [Clostridiales bacterium]
MCSKGSDKCRKNLIRLLLIGLLIALCGRRKGSSGTHKRRQVNGSSFGKQGSFQRDGWGYSDWSAL